MMYIRHKLLLLFNLVRWCSWLSRLLYTEKVGSSTLSRITHESELNHRRKITLSFAAQTAADGHQTATIHLTAGTSDLRPSTLSRTG